MIVTRRSRKPRASINWRYPALQASLHPDVVEQVVSAAPAPPHHQAIVCDVSASTLAFACDGNALLRAFDFWVARGLVRPGSSLSVAVVGPSRDTMRTVFDLSVPDRSLGERIAFILVARAQLAQLPGTYFKENASAIIETIHVAVSKLRERQGRYDLIVLSDLRHRHPPCGPRNNLPCRSQAAPFGLVPSLKYCARQPGTLGHNRTYAPCRIYAR